MESFRVAISTINRFISVVNAAFQSLLAPVSMVDSERLSMLVHHAQESQTLACHTSGHVFAMC